MCEALAENPRLQKLSLRQLHIWDAVFMEEVTNTFGRITALNTLVVHYCSDFFVAVIFQGLQGCSTLECVELDFEGYAPENVGPFLASLPRMRVLRTEWVNDRFEFPSSLTQLVIHDGEPTMASLTRVLRQTPNLQTLDLHRFHVFRGDPGLDDFREALEQMDDLESITLRSIDSFDLLRGCHNLLHLAVEREIHRAELQLLLGHIKSLELRCNLQEDYFSTCSRFSKKMTILSV